MTAKELERLITERGGNASALDTVTRKLREATTLATGGRGFNAPALTPSEAAWILIAYAGSDVAARAGHTVLTFSTFRRQSRFELKEPGVFLGNDFGFTLQELLQEPHLLEYVESVSLARNIPLATINLKDGRRVGYCHETKDLEDVEALAAESFLSEGVLSGGLLTRIARSLAADVGELAE